MEKVLNRKVETIVKKYNYRPFMYVEYPHKSFWSKRFNDQNFRTGLRHLFLSKKVCTIWLPTSIKKRENAPIAILVLSIE